MPDPADGPPGERRLPAHEARRLWAVAAGDRAAYEALARRRLAGEPLQYLEGTAAFGPLELVIDERVLVPRPETEQLWELAVRLVDAPSTVVDLCTGSGALALACKTSWPDARVLGTDLSAAAIEVATLNAERTGLDVEFLVGDLFAPLPAELRGRVDLIVANPPYVPEGDWGKLPVDVRREPRMALVAGPDGMATVRRIGREAEPWLRRGGRVVCEIGEEQGSAAAGAFSILDDVEVRVDLAGRQRFVTAVQGTKAP